MDFMDCKELLQQVKDWEATGKFPANRIPAMENHLATCKAGCEQYALLLPFLQKDAGLPAFRETIPESGSVSSLVMAGISRKKLPGKRNYWLPAVAAAVLILAGTVFYIPRLLPAAVTGEIVVRFELKAAEAHSVHLVGDFSNWDPFKIPLEDNDKDGVWLVKIRLKKNRSYTYNFLINDDIWIPDPESDLIVNDGFGGVNSIINL